jgi:tetratricopeptide (TPR) repeat protein
MRDAEDALRRRDLTAAAGHLERYTTLRPTDAAGWLLAARTARRREQFAEAERFLDRCRDEGGAADSIAFERDLALVQQGRLGEIDVRLRSTIDPDHPDVALVLEALARGYMEVGRLVDARDACNLWKAVDPTHPWPWDWLGLISERMEQWDQAEAFYTEAIRLDPEDRSARMGAARVLLRKRRPGEAATHYQWVLARNPDDSEALARLAECLIDEGRPGEAVPLLDRVLNAEPTSGGVLYLRGKAALVLADPTGAEVWLRRSLTHQPSDAETMHLLVQSLRSQQKNGEAEEFATRLEQLREDLSRLAELVRQIGTKLDDAGPSHEAGVIALRVGRTKDGLNLLHDALRRKGDHRRTHAVLAEHYRGAGRLNLAEYHRRLAEAP